MEVIGYLGPDGSYTQLAAQRLCPEARLNEYESFHKGFAKLSSGEFDGIVVPIENALNGGVMQNLDLLQASENAVAVREVTVEVDHRLATLKGADLKNIKRVYSHAQALEQCGRFIAEKLPSAQLIPTLSTAAGLDKLKTVEDACIAGSHIKRDGIVLSEKNVSDEKRNFTRFLLVRRGKITEDMSGRKIYFSVTCKNRSGALSDLLRPICDNGLNMTKIESRPIKDRPDEYRFFIETEGDYSTPEIKKTINEVRAAANSFKLLGCY